MLQALPFFLKYFLSHFENSFFFTNVYELHIDYFQFSVF